MDDIEIKGVKIKVGIKIKIYGNQKALGIPKGFFTIKRIYKINNEQHIELNNSLNASVVGKIKMLEMVDFKLV